MSLEANLEELKEVIRNQAMCAGLNIFEVIFEVINADEMNAIAAYGGFPNRYPHWRFGMEYERLSKGYTYGFSKIYEMVVNNDPCYAYLMQANSLVDQKLVMTHVYGHSDFFKNNIFFARTNRKMMDEFGNHRSKIQRLMLQHGQDKIEDFIDICLSLENLIDANAPIRQPKAELSVDNSPSGDKAKSLTEYVRPEKDVLLYLLERAPLADWQQEILSMIREEAYYFAPQKQTKIINEGWASYQHSQLLTGGILSDAEIVDYADRHSGSMQMVGGMLNPYKIGIELFRDIERRWNRGQFGKEYDECDDMHEKENWDLSLGLGREKIFEVRRFHDDVTFLDDFLTPEFCERQKLFTYVYNPKSSQYQIKSRNYQEIKSKLLQILTNGGNPVIGIKPGEEDKLSELHLKHYHEGVDLKIDYARETLKNLYMIWKRPVHLETVIEEVPKRLSCDGSEVRERRIS